MKRLIVASNNDHKIKEIKEILTEFPLEIMSLKEADINIDVEETGTTFMENAYIKASEIKKILKDSMVLADDSGLSVDALNGEPGVYSARYSGEHGNDIENNEKLLRELSKANTKDRTARFICAMVLIIDDNNSIKVQGEVEGTIIEECKGLGGFGYDPLFYVSEFNKTFGEMTSEEKNSISHRGMALQKLKEELKNIKI